VGFFRLAELTPGARSAASYWKFAGDPSEIVDGNTISGIRGSAISFLLDGVDVSEQHQGGTFIQTSIDALPGVQCAAKPVFS